MRAPGRLVLGGHGNGDPERGRTPSPAASPSNAGKLQLSQVGAAGSGDITLGTGSGPWR